MGAPTFKEQIAADISTTFLNCLEFAAVSYTHLTLPTKLCV